MRQDNNAKHEMYSKLEEISRYRMKKKTGKGQGKERRINHLLTKEETRKNKQRNEKARCHRLVSMTSKERGCDSRTRKKWKKINMKNKTKKDGAKKEYENTIWNKEGVKSKKIKKRLKFATMNIQGVNTLGKRHEIQRWMNKTR